MKAPWVVSAVVAVHCVAVGSVLLSQGCRTSLQGSGTPPPEPKMPPAEIGKAVVKLPNPSPPPTPVPKDLPAETTEYTIQQGESLSIVASRYGLRVDDIVVLNGLKDSNRIRAGQKILLPGKIDLKAAKPVTAKPKAKPAVPSEKVGPQDGGALPAAADAGAGSVHVVKKGDMLSRIASQYHVKVSELKKANGLESDRIREGQRLKIPGAAVEAATLTDMSLPAEPKTKAAAVTPMPMTKPETSVPGPAAAPSVQPPMPGDPAVPEASAGPKDSGRTHVVEANEDVYSVALLWDVNVDDLKALNNLTDANLKPGLKLKIPISR